MVRLHDRLLIKRFKPNRGGEQSLSCSNLRRLTAPPSFVSYTKPMKYFMYVRKSTDDKDKQIASISSQIDELTELASRLDYEIVHIYQESKSAKAPGVRTEFYAMLERIKKGDAEGILCWKLDRLARNPIDGASISWLLQQGVLKHLKTFEREYLPGDNVLMAALEFGMANQFIQDLRSNTIRGMKAKAEKGIFPTHAPLGYLNDPGGKQGEKKIYIDEKRFPIIRTLWDLLLSGKYSVGEITKIAQTELGLTGMKGDPISDSVLYVMFGNPFYYGKFNWQGKVWDGTHTPMITKEEFDMAQRVIKRKGPYETNKETFAYTRIMKCEECGSSITAEKKIRKLSDGSTRYHAYYRCSRLKGPGTCTMPYLKITTIEEKIEEILLELDIHPSLSKWIFDTLREEFKSQKDAQKQAKENLEQSVARYDRQLQNLLDMRINGEIDYATYETKKEEVTKLRTQTLGVLEKTDNRLEQWFSDTESDFNWSQEALDTLHSDNLPAKREILIKLSESITMRHTGLDIELSPIFKTVRRTHKIAQEENIDFGRENIFIRKRQNGYFNPLSIKLGAYRDLNPDWEFHKLQC